MRSKAFRGTEYTISRPRDLVVFDERNGQPYLCEPSAGRDRFVRWGAWRQSLEDLSLRRLGTANRGTLDANEARLRHEFESFISDLFDRKRCEFAAQKSAFNCCSYACSWRRPSVCLAQESDLDPFTKKLAPSVGSPENAVEKMLQAANLKPGETLYDLGCGDGRILLKAAKKYRVKAVGIEISRSRWPRRRRRMSAREAWKIKSRSFTVIS